MHSFACDVWSSGRESATRRRPPVARRAFAILAAIPLLGAAAEAAPAEEKAWLCGAAKGEIVVSTAAEFRRALERVGAGGVIALRPGTYDRLPVRGFRRSGFVVVRSANPDRPAEIAALDVRGSDHLWFQQLRFASSRVPDGAGTYLVKVSRSSDIGIVASEFHGSLDGNHDNDPSGARFLAADRIVFAANRLHDLTRGVVIGGARDVRVSGNRFADLRTDGANFAGVQDVLVDRNLFTSFHPAPKDHPDFIQFWQRNALIEDTRGVVIRANTFLQGHGSPTQTIFIGNKVPGRVYRDFVIEDNVIYNSHPHGISLYDLENGRIARNTLVTFPDGNRTFPGGKYAPRINLFRVRNVTVVANVAPGLAQKEARDVATDRNLLTGLDTFPSARHLERLFVDPDARANATAASFAPRPGGALDLPDDERIGALPAAMARGASGRSSERDTGEHHGCS